MVLYTYDIKRGLKQRCREEKMDTRMWKVGCYGFLQATYYGIMAFPILKYYTRLCVKKSVLIFLHLKAGLERRNEVLEFIDA